MYTATGKRSPLPAILLTLFVFFTALFGYLVYHVLVMKNIDMDDAVATYLTLHYNEGIGNLMKLFTILGSAAFLIVCYILICGFYTFFRKNYQIAIRILITGFCGYALMTILKVIFHRTRPLHPLIHALNTFSFPSGHTTTSIVFFGILIYLICKERIQLSTKVAWSTGLIILGLLVGLSRVYLREHFFTDVLAGICVAYIDLYLTLLILETFQPIKRIGDKIVNMQKK